MTDATRSARIKPAPEAEQEVLKTRIEYIRRTRERQSREARIKEARQLGYDIVVHSATGIVGSSR